MRVGRFVNVKCKFEEWVDEDYRGVGKNVCRKWWFERVFGY